MIYTLLIISVICFALFLGSKSENNKLKIRNRILTEKLNKALQSAAQNDVESKVLKEVKSKDDYLNKSVLSKDYKSPIAYYENEKNENRDYFKPKDIDSSHILNKKKVVFSGEFDSLTRDDIFKMAWDVGADINTAISKKTDYFIIGHNYGESKMNKAKELIKDGHSLIILKEQEYLALF